MSEAFRIKIPRDQPDVVFTDEAWKQYIERLKEKYNVIEISDEHVSYEYTDDTIIEKLQELRPKLDAGLRYLREK